ncbi:MAG: sporulation initiation factor Spo0A C-terminal domain-containing protein [Clostridia bacterium]|nr:sporulation initiation factor Spo0A C-terminal domain-containing protein [Clostridia bacterium]
MIEFSNYEEAKLLQIAIMLRRLGLYRNYKGYNRLAYAVYLVTENSSRLEAVVKEVYMPVAEKYHCSWGAVERCLRHIILKTWTFNYDELCELADTKLKKPPTPAELLDIFAVYLSAVNA